MNFINFELLDTLLGLLLCALFVLGTLFIATEVRASSEAGPTLADSGPRGSRDRNCRAGESARLSATRDLPNHPDATGQEVVAQKQERRPLLPLFAQPNETEGASHADRIDVQ